MPDSFPPIFDGHNDVLLKLFRKNRASATTEFANTCSGHVDVPRAQAGGFGGGFFAIYVPSPPEGAGMFEEMLKPAYDLPLPEPINHSEALNVTMAQAAILGRLEDEGSVKICTTTSEIRATLDEGKMAAIMHLEGAEGISADLDELEVLYRAGLRSVGPVWSRSTIFGEGVPFRFPSTGDIGPGLTDAGKNLVRACNDMKILLDLSHLNEAGFWDIARLSDAPLVATHSNAYELCPHARNLTDKQLDAIAESDGMVGINFAVAFLRPDGTMRADTGLDVMMRHLDYLIEKLGEDRVGFGSDFDGAVVPAEIKDVAGLPNLRAAMKSHGVDDALMAKICNGNWLRVLAKTWGE